MKKIFVAVIVSCAVTSCNNGVTEKADSTDNGGLTNPTAIDTTKHPSGIENSSVISTDTAAMNTQNAINKAKAAKKE